MNRIKYENYLGAAGYDAVARRKIKELEEKIGSGGSNMIEKVLYQTDEARLYPFNGLHKHHIDAYVTFVDGKKYDVVFDGTTYKCVAVSVAGPDGASSVALGNIHLAIPDFADTGEPFMIIPSDDNYAIFAKDGFSSVKISTMEEKASGGGNSKPLIFIVTNGQVVIPEGSPSIEEFIKGNLGGAEGSISFIWPQAFACMEPESFEISICTKVKYEPDMSGVNLSFSNRDFTIRIDLSTYRAALVNNKPN